jgi:hypothetical protein
MHNTIKLTEIPQLKINIDIVPLQYKYTLSVLNKHACHRQHINKHNHTIYTMHGKQIHKNIFE